MNYLTKLYNRNNKKYDNNKMGSCCGNTLFEFQNFTSVLKNAPKVGKNIKLIYMQFEVDEYSTQIIRQRYPDFN